MSDALLDILHASGVMQMALPQVGPSLPVSGQTDLDLIGPMLAGAVVPSPALTVGPDLPAVLQNHFLYDFYYRIWVVPETLTAQNPAIGVAIPFAIWNAYPQPVQNVLESISVIGADGLSLDFEAGDAFRAIEYRNVNITITPAAPINISATFEFNFTDGTGLFYFLATIADFVQMVPDPPVVERWSWLTDVIESRDATEQRIMLRNTPRRNIKYSFLLEDETERRRQYNRWFKSLGGRIVLPYYQYHTRITQESAPGTSQLFFDPALTDVRDGEFVLVLDEATNTGNLVKIETVTVDGCVTDGPLTFTALPTMIIAPAFTSRLADRTGLTMKSVTGQIDVQAEAVTSRLVFRRPGSTAVIQAYDGYPVLHLRPIATGETPEIFDANYEIVDGQTGIQDVFKSWPHPAVGATRKFTIRRRQNPAEMDWWRDFLDTLKGQNKTFLMPTWFADLPLAVAPEAGAVSLTVTHPDYGPLYWPFETFKRIQLETSSGMVWRRVTGVVDNEDGTSTLLLNTALGLTPEEIDVSKISFLNLVRLSSDVVTLTHERLRTQIELSTKTVDR